MIYCRLFLCLILLSVSGCSAFGVPATSDPYQKLVYAYEMMDMSRPIAARKFLAEALQSFEETNNILGAAEAYHAYGNFYKNRNMGFKAYDKAEESFRKALGLYEKKNNYMGMMKSSFGIGSTFVGREDFPKACEAYESSKGYYLKAMEINPNEKTAMNPKYSNPGEMIDAFMKSLNCDQILKVQ